MSDSSPSSRTAPTECRARVLMITPGYPPAVGGTEIQCARLSEALVARGHDVKVVTRGYAGASPSEVRCGVVIRRSRVWGGPRSPVTRALSAFAFLRVVWRESRTVRGLPAALIHHHGLGMSLVIARLALGRRRVPIVAKVLCGGDGGECARIRRDRRFAPVRWALGGVDRLVALQPALVEELAAVGVSADRIVEIPNGVTLPEATDRVAAAREATTVLFGGRLDPQKDVGTLIEAWPAVCAAIPEARLVIAGEGPERSAIAARIAALGMGGSIEILGLIPDYLERLARAAVFVLPSRFEGMSNALLEALARGRPCVVSDLPENHHTGGDACRYFPVGDAAALAACLTRVLRSADERVRLGRAARARAEREFAMDAVVHRYERLYAALLPAR